MELREAVLGRRSIRRFKNEPVPEEVIEEIIGLAVHAPTPGNTQMWGFHVVLSREVKERLAKTIAAALEKIAIEAGRSGDWLEGPRRSATFFVEAPVLIAVSTERYRSKVDETMAAAGHPQSFIDELRCRPDLQGIGAAVQTMLLAAYEKGLGTCWMTGPMAARPELEKILGITPPRSLAAFVALGYPDQEPGPKKLKSVLELVEFIR
ncbi:MAG: nitroreductase family protein [Desulfotomaculales bacterium]